MKFWWLWFLSLVLSAHGKWVTKTTKGYTGVLDSSAAFLFGGQTLTLSEYVNEIEGQGHPSPVDTECAGIVNIAYNSAGVSFILRATSIELHLIKDRAGCLSDVYVNGAFFQSADTLGNDSENTSDGICDWLNIGIEFPLPGLQNVTVVHQVNDNTECWFWVHSVDYSLSVPVWSMKATIIGASVGGGIGLLIIIGVLAYCLRRGFFSCSCRRTPAPPDPPAADPAPAYHSRFNSMAKDATADGRSMASIRY